MSTVAVVNCEAHSTRGACSEETESFADTSHNRGEVPQRGEASHVDDSARCSALLGEAARLLKQLRFRPAHELPLYMCRRSHVPHADARVAGRRVRGHRALSWRGYS